jgi:hypothetical protein
VDVAQDIPKLLWIELGLARRWRGLRTTRKGKDKNQKKAM